MFNYTHYKNITGSEAIDELYYDEPTKVLVVEFLNGNESAYRDVPVSVFHEFAKADSAGKFYNAFVKGQFAGVPAPFGPYLERRGSTGNSTGNHLHATVTNDKTSAPKGFKVSGVVTFDVTDILVHAESVSEAVAKFEKALREAVFDNGTVQSVDLDVSGVVKA